MSAALRSLYRRWYGHQRLLSVIASDESFSPSPEGLHFWHRMRVRRMYGVRL